MEAKTKELKMQLLEYIRNIKTRKRIYNERKC